MSSSEPFDADKIVSLWTELFQLQIDLGYYPDADSISFPPPEGRTIDESVCQELGLTDEVVSLMKRLPCPSTFDEAWDTTIFNESVAVPFTDDRLIRNSRDPDNCWIESMRPDYMNPTDLALVVEKDESGYHLVLDTKENTVRFFVAMMGPCDFNDEDQVILERPDDRMHYRNCPARPAIEVLEELVAKFRDLDWIPIRYDGGWPEILAAESDGFEDALNAYTKTKNILQSQFGWPDNFDKEAWGRQRNEICKQVMHPSCENNGEEIPKQMTAASEAATCAMF